MRPKGLALLALPAAVLALAAAGAAATSTLPGGTSFEVAVTSPREGAVLPEATPYTVSARATIGAAAPIANTFLITVIDVSGSTFGSVGTTLCGNQNALHDALGNTVLDCELAAAKALNTAAASQGTVADVGIVGFAGRLNGTTVPLSNEAAALDLGPTLGAQTFVPPASDANANGARDVEEVLASAFNRNVTSTFGVPAGTDAVGFTNFDFFSTPGTTNYWAAITAARSLAATAPAGLAKVVVMLSDGDSTIGSPSGQGVAAALAGISDITIYTFAIGNLASCNGTTTANFGTLQQIADATHGTCRHLTDPAAAVAVVPTAISSSIGAFGVSDTGGASFDDPTTVSGTLTGPGSADFSRSYPAASATPGPKTLCARATGHDGGGPGSIADCVHVTIKARPTIAVDGAGTVGAVPEGSPFTIGASVTGAATTTWSAAGGTGTCTFANPSAPNTTVTCDDNGFYTLTLTAKDAVNPDATATRQLQVSNVAPTPTLTLSRTLAPIGGSVDAHVAISDPGKDVFVCNIAWGDGATSVVLASGTSCDASHGYAAAGTQTVGVTAADDDGGSGSTSGTVTVKAPPALTLTDGGDGPGGHAAEVPEGSPFGLHTAVVGATSTSWTASGGSGACTFADAGSATTQVTCNDDGLYTLVLTAVDSFGQTSTVTEHLLVDNVAPTATLTLSSSSVAKGGSVTADLTFTDPGAHDTHLCTIDWGDGSLATTGCHASHTFAGGGLHRIVGTVTDDDGGSGADAKTVRVNGPPLVTVSSASGNEGAAIPVSATVSDPDGDTTALHWSAVPGAGVDAGATCTFADPSVSTTTVTCTDDGTWTLTLSANDGVNPVSSSDGTLTVANLAPTLALSGNAAGRTATVTGAVTDAGANDALACSFDWGDGSPATPIAVTAGGCTAAHTYAGAASGYSVTVTASDDDGGSTTSTKTIRVNAAPVVTVSDAFGSEGAAIPVSAAVSDPDGDTPVIVWSATPGPGVDAGATCTFANPNSAATTVTCTDDGSWTLLLTANDGVNPAVSSTGMLTVANVAPVTTLTLSSTSIAKGGSVTADLTFTDAGSNDTHVCSIDWGDGSPATATCHASHTFAAGGAFHVAGTVSDDDGGTGSDTKTVRVNAPASVTVTNASGNEGAAIPVTASVSDPDGDATLLHWSATPGTGCTFADATAATTTVTCTDDGKWTLTLSADDGINPAVSSSGTLTVANVAPTVTLSASIAGRTATVSATVSDPGANDTVFCSIDWGDGSSETTPCTGSHTYAPGPSSFTITATATDDDGGTGTVSKTVHVNRPPVVTVGNAAGDEGAAIPVTATVGDPDGDTTLVHWSAAPGPGVDAGATCSFGNASVLTTNATCTDDGTWTLTLTANDGVNPATTATGTLTVANVAPTLSLTGSIAGLTATVSGTVADAGTNDTVSCTIVWGDGSSGAGCSGSHTYTTGASSYTVTVTASDGDGATVTKSITFTGTAKALKLQVLAQLKALLATATRRDDIARLTDAVRKLSDSLDASRWIDGNHLMTKNGKKVFDGEQYAARKLEDQLKDKKSSVAISGIPAMLAGLVQADALLASTAVADAASRGGDARRLAEARREIAKAQAAAAHGDADGAIDLYGEAWEDAVGSLRRGD